MIVGIDAVFAAIGIILVNEFHVFQLKKHLFLMKTLLSLYQ
jgi:hypothetical protein